jgi:hypothetical protein
LQNNTEKDWKSFFNFFHRQENLVSFEVKEVFWKTFEDRDDWDFKTLQKLSIDSTVYANPSVFQSLTKFVKTLDKIADLELKIMSDLRRDDRDYTELLTHLFSLGSLNQLTFDLEGQSMPVNLKVRNASVEKIVLEKIPIGKRYSCFLRWFPEIQSAKLGFLDVL